MYLASFYFKQVGHVTNSHTLSEFKIWPSSGPLPDYVQIFLWLCVLDLQEWNILWSSFDCDSSKAGVIGLCD